MQTISHYDQNAEQFVSQYESLTFEDVHPALLDLLPPPGSTILDAGSGSGRDAAWFAAKGYDVVAAEPSDAMRTLARSRHPSPRIHWIADSLPDLGQTRRLGLTFDLILVSAVWMHVPPTSRQRALRKLATLLSPNGRIVISLRLGPPDTDRAMYEVTLPELTAMARQFGLRLVHTDDSPDRLGRQGISWTTAVLGLPDDGLGALPLLRHLILTDGKSSTYKIALLRILARIADTAAGAVRHESEFVVLPMVPAKSRYETDAKADIDNCLKPIIDAFTGPTGLFINDCQLKGLYICWRTIESGDERLIFTFEYDPDQYCERQGLAFLRLDKGLCCYVNTTWPKAARIAWVAAMKTGGFFKSQLEKLGVPYLALAGMQGGSQPFHITRTGGFPLLTEEEFIAGIDNARCLTARKTGLSEK